MQLFVRILLMLLLTGYIYQPFNVCWTFHQMYHRKSESYLFLFSKIHRPAVLEVLTQYAPLDEHVIFFRMFKQFKETVRFISDFVNILSNACI